MSNEHRNQRTKVLLFLVIVTGASLTYRIYQGTMNIKKTNRTEATVSIERLFAQANEQYKNKNYQEAINLYHELLKQDPTHKQAHISVGLASVRIGNINHAQHHAQQVIKLDETYLPAYMLLGQCYQTKGEIDKAEATYQYALSKDENFFEGHLFLSQLIAQKNPEEALKHAHRATALKPDDTLAQEVLQNARILVQTMSKTEATA